MSSEIKSDVRRRCLAPATGQHICVIYDSGNTYYYAVYRNKLKSVYLAYSTDAVNWTAEKLLILESGSTVVGGVSLALDHTNKEIYVVFSELSMTSSDIRVIPVNCSTPASPSLGSKYTVTGYSDHYHMPVCALGIDGGLHVGAIRYDFGGVTTNYYVIKSGISSGEPDLTSWSAIHNVGDVNHASWYGSMKIVAHPDENKIVIFCPNFFINMRLGRSFNPTGAWDGWMAIAPGTHAMRAFTTYLDSVLCQTYDLGVITGWDDAMLVTHFSSGWIYAYTYTFTTDTGMGNIPYERVVDVTGGAISVTSDNDVSVAACLYPGDKHFHFFFEGYNTHILYNTSYSYFESQLTGRVTIETGTYDPSCLTSVWYPAGVYTNKICFLELDQ